jgi:DNA-binding NarL/FixJ family response regulator
MIRVCLADDQALFRGGLRALLALFAEIEVVAEAEEGEAPSRRYCNIGRTCCCWTFACRA